MKNLDIIDTIKNIVDGSSDMGVCEEYIVCEECPSYDKKMDKCIFPKQRNINSGKIHH